MSAPLTTDQNNDTTEQVKAEPTEVGKAALGERSSSFSLFIPLRKASGRVSPSLSLNHSTELSTTAPVLNK